MNLTSSRLSKGVLVSVGIIVALSFVLAAQVPLAHAQLNSTQIQAILDLLTSFGADQTTINNVNSALNGQPTTGGSGSPSGAALCTFTRSLTIGATGADVTCLQDYLTSTGHFTFSGGSTGYFGPITQSAVAAWQAANGVSPAVGYFGPISTAKYNQVAGGTGTGPGPTVPGTGLSVAPGSQPPSQLFVEFAARVPFTRFSVTASANGPVTINNVTVGKAGSVNRNVFGGVVLLDQNGIQLGDARTLNSNDQAVIGTAVTIPAGTTRNFTIAANAPASSTGLDSYNGQVGGLSLIGVNTSASVSGSLPVAGAMHTVNSTLSIGTATVERGTNDPNADRSREIGTTDYRFSSIRVTAGAAEDVRLNSVRWKQSSSAGPADLSNVVVEVDGVNYPTTNDGDYYTALFGGGLVIEEGFSKDIAIKADLLNPASNGDTVQFDVEETSDLYVSGETYGYGILPTASATSGSAADAGSQFPTAANPFFDGSEVTITGGSVTTIAKSNSVPSQNVAINIPNQPLGAFSVNLLGEGLEVDGITFGIDITNGSANATDLTSVTLVDENGSVVAGPVDGTNAGVGENGEIVFSDLIEFPTGNHTYSLRGKLSTDFVNGDTIQATTTVNTTYWVDPEGSSTGDAYSLPGNEVTMNTLTVNAASLSISVGSTPAAQSVVAGAQGFTFANYIFDTTASGEDVRLSSIPLEANGTLTATSTMINGCQLWDGGTALNTGSNVVNGSDIQSAAADTTFTFNNTLTIAKGSTKTLALKCNVSSSATGTFQWGVDSTADPTVTGVSSGSAVAENITDSNGQLMTLASAGTVTVSVDSTDPSEMWYLAGAEATVGVFELLTTNEAFTLRDIEFVLDTASSSKADIAEIALYDGTTNLTGWNVPALTNNSELFSNLNFNLPENDDKNLTVKVKFASIGPSQGGTSGNLVRFATSTSSSNNEAQGLESGTIVTLDDNSVATSTGARYFRSLPQVARASSASQSVAAATDVNLYEFTVTALGDDIAVGQFTLDVATSAASVTNLDLIEVGSGKSVDILTSLAATTATFSFAGANTEFTNGFLEIGPGETKTFRLEGDITDGDTTNASGIVTVKLKQDSSYPSLATGVMTNEATADASNFTWSPLSTTSPNVENQDWTNGYRVPGIEFGDLSGTTSSGI